MNSKVSEGDGVGQEPPPSLRRVNNEINGSLDDYGDGIKATPLDQFKQNWLARIHGPIGSPYEGRIFYLNIKIPPTYPYSPPTVRFLTKVYHPAVSRHGDIGLDRITYAWAPFFHIATVLVSIQSLLTDPPAMVNMEPAIASLYYNDRVAFEEMARSWTRKFAMHETLLS